MKCRTALSFLAAALVAGTLGATSPLGGLKGETFPQVVSTEHDGNDGRDGLVGIRLPRKPQSVPGELLVQYRKGISAQSKAEAILPLRGRSLETVHRADDRLIPFAPGAIISDPRGDLERVSLPAGVSTDEAIRLLKAHPDVEFAQPNWIYHSLAAPNDPRYAAGNLWGLYGPATSPSNAYGLNALAAWNAG
ncbi:MAG: hypothetical protein EPN23_11415, partial [Verrucomicrobia bacterium]